VLIACVNVSGLMASRSLDRGREIALRRSLGARGRDVARLVLAESALLVGAGCVVGLLLAQPALALVLRLMPPDIGLLKTPAIDARVIAFAAIAAALAAVVVSIWPLRQFLRRRAQPRLVVGGHSTTRTRSAGRVVVVSVQVALGLMLTLGGTLLVGSLVRVWQNDMGHRTDDIVTLEGTPDGATPPERAIALDAVLERIRALPGVESAGATAAGLWRSSGPGGLFAGDTYAITPGFLETLAPRLIEGRWPSADEFSSGAPVAVVTPFVVQKQLAGGPAIGRALSSPAGTFSVIGVAAPALYGGPEWMKNFPQYYLPYRASALRTQVTIVIRSPSHAADVLTWALGEFKQRTTPMRVTAAATADDLLRDTVRLRRFQAWLFGSFAAAALVIVAAGLLGLIAMGVARRTREVGIRVALGSTRTGIVRLLMREQLLAVVLGLAAGAVASIWTVRLVKEHVYENAVYDARLWAVAIVTMAIVATIGVLVPARRASTVDPVRSLRVE
jgi:predicted permease